MKVLCLLFLMIPGSQQLPLPVVPISSDVALPPVADTPAPHEASVVFISGRVGRIAP